MFLKSVDVKDKLCDFGLYNSKWLLDYRASIKSAFNLENINRTLYALVNQASANLTVEMENKQYGWLNHSLVGSTVKLKRLWSNLST